MLSFLLIILVIILVVVLSHKDRDARKKLDHHGVSYQQGYWDGVRASEQGISSTGSASRLVSAQQDTSFTPPIGQPPAPDMSRTYHKENHLTVNITLYVASLLLIGGVSLFVKSFTPGLAVTFFLVLIVAAAYYGFGFMLYRSIPVLKPVSVAFVGTALAMMPYVGYLLNQAFVHDGSVSWFITSIACLVVYLYAAIRLRSELLGYCIVIILVSSADSLAGVFDTGILWFIVLVMAVGAVITFIAAARPNWLPEVLRRPFIATQYVLVPLAVLWSLFLYTQLSADQYTVVFAVATFYYGAAALQAMAGSSHRTWLWAAARATATVAAGFFVYKVTNSWYSVGIALAVIGALQVAVSSLLLPTRQVLMNQHELWLWGGFILIMIAALFSAGEVQWARPVTAELVGLIVLATLVAGYLKRSELLVFSIYGLILLPLIGGHYLWHSIIADWAISIIYGVLLSLVVFVRLRYVRSENQTNVTLVYTAQIAFSCMTIIMGYVANTDTHHLWPVFAFVVVAVATYITAWVEKRRWVVVAANVAAVLAVSSLTDVLHLQDMPSLFFVAAISSIGFYGVYLALRYKAAEERLQRTMWWSALVMAIGPSLIGLFSDEAVLVSGFGLLLFVAGSILVYDDYENRRLRFADIGLIITVLGLQRIITQVAPNTNGLFYSHWWVALAFVLAYLRTKYGKTSQDKEISTVYQVIGLIILTWYSYWYATTHSTEGWVQIVFLIEHVGLVFYGLVRNHLLFTVWGAVGVTVAILVMLPGFTFILLPLLGLGMIAGVIHVILRGKTPPPQVK